MKIVVSNPSDGKSYQKEIDDVQTKTLISKKIGDVVSGDSIGLAGYELEIRGGSDQQGFPMRGDFHGTSRKKLLLGAGPGYKPQNRGIRMRKSVRGNVIASDLAQINMKVLKLGAEGLDKLIGSTKKEEKK